LLRQDPQLDLAFLDVENSVCGVSLREGGLPLTQPDPGFPGPDPRQKQLGIALAEMIGTTRSRVSFFMNKFRNLGFIEYNGSLRVHSSLLNVVLHD
jgi:hypothetical protein